MINLLPPKRLLALRVARSNTILRRYIELVVLGMVLLVAVILGAYYYLYQQQRSTQKTLELNQQKLAELEPVQDRAEQLSASITTIASLLDRDIEFSKMLTQITSLLPAGTALTGLQFSIEDTAAPLVISAQVENEERAAVLRNNLAQSPLFDKAEIKTITKNDSTTQPSANSANPAPAAPAGDSPYAYTVIIDAYFKPLSAAKPGAQP